MHDPTQTAIDVQIQSVRVPFLQVRSSGHTVARPLFSCALAATPKDASNLSIRNPYEHEPVLTTGLVDRACGSFGCCRTYDTAHVCCKVASISISCQPPNKLADQRKTHTFVQPGFCRHTHNKIQNKAASNLVESELHISQRIILHRLGNRLRSGMPASQMEIRSRFQCQRHAHCACDNCGHYGPSGLPHTQTHTARHRKMRPRSTSTKHRRTRLPNPG